MSTATVATTTGYPEFAESSESVGSAVDRLLASVESEREVHAAEIARLDRIITDLSRERALLAAERDRLAAHLASFDHPARQWRLLQAHVSGPLADYIADQVTVRLETYQDDGSGRYAVCLDQEQVSLDMSEEEFVPEVIKFVKELPDGTEAKFRAKLDAKSLRYDIEYAD